MKNSLSTKGLSLSQASSIANVLYQRCVEIDREINNYNVCSKSIKIDGETHFLQQSIPATDIVQLTLKKAAYHAVQAFLMENIKAKDSVLAQIKTSYPTLPPRPETPDYVEPVLNALVTEEWGWNQLTISEGEEYLEAEAYAAHIGQIIHKNGKLTQLRQELSELPSIEWYSVEKDKQTPVIIQANIKAVHLMKDHETLADLHRKHEMRVNYFKAKVKNLVTEKNTTISTENASTIQRSQTINNQLREAYKSLHSAWGESCDQITETHQAEIMKRTTECVNLRIAIPERFKAVVDEIMAKE